MKCGEGSMAIDAVNKKQTHLLKAELNALDGKQETKQRVVTSHDIGTKNQVDWGVDSALEAELSPAVCGEGRGRGLCKWESHGCGEFDF